MLSIVNGQLMLSIVNGLILFKSLKDCCFQNPCQTPEQEKLNTAIAIDFLPHMHNSYCLGFANICRLSKTITLNINFIAGPFTYVLHYLLGFGNDKAL